MPQPPNKVLRLFVPVALAVVGVVAAVAVFVNSGKPVANRQASDGPGGRPPAAVIGGGGDTDPDPTTEPGTDSGSLQAADDESETASESIASQAEQVVPPSEDTEPSTIGDTVAGAVDAASDALGLNPGAPEANAPEAGAPEAEAASPEALSLIDSLRLRPVAREDLDAVGSLDPETGYTLFARFAWAGAGLESLELSGLYDDVDQLTAARLGQPVPEDAHVALQSVITAPAGSAQAAVIPMAALELEIATPGRTPVRLPLTGTTVISDEGAAQTWRVWRQTAPGAFEAVVEDDEGKAVLRLNRRFVIETGSSDVALEQTIENLSGAPFTIRWIQMGPTDLPADLITYGGDKRRVRFGYLLNARQDPTRATVVANEYLTPRQDSLGSTSELTGLYETERVVWPNPKSIDRDYSLVWAAMTNRYFGVAVHPGIDPDATGTDKSFRAVERVTRIMLDPASKSSAIALKLASPALDLAAGQTADLSMRFYAGPLNKPIIRQSPFAEAAGITELVVYNFGGFCAFCTFSWLTGPLIGLLRGLHSVLSDYALSIICLVFIVRGLLHPVMRWSQIRMQRFGKQMADMAPKQKKIQEKFKDDPKRMQAEMGKLWREEGVNPAGMLGCLPLFLQSPIWIALYATLFFAFDLRHQPAFFGVFQNITGGAWPFLADLARPDSAIPLPSSFSIPFLSGLMGDITAINVLPLLMGGVFFVHQKYLTPPTATALTPEQQSTQNMMKIMSVVMFPIFMYNAPSGLTLYFITNSTIAIIESKWIRAHIDKHDLLNVKKTPKKSKPGGSFFERLQKAAEEQQRLREQNGGRRSVPNTARGKGKESPADRARRGKG